MMLLFVLTIILMEALVVSLPSWPSSKNWGYCFIGGASVVIPIILILVLAGKLHTQ
jgi:hypothetical protein